jgi:hypothetical protein
MDRCSHDARRRLSGYSLRPRYRVVKLAIEEGRPSADTFSIFLVTGLVILLSAALIIYMLLTSGK